MPPSMMEGRLHTSRFRRNVFLLCQDCGHVFMNTVTTGVFCRRCRSVDLALWRPRLFVTAESPRSRRLQL